MPPSNFLTEISEQVRSIKSEYEYPNEGTAFGHFVLRDCLSKILDFGEIADPELDRFIKECVTDGKDDNGIDAVIVGNGGLQLYLFQFKYSDWNQYDYQEFKKTMTFLDSLVFNDGKLDTARCNLKLKTALETKIRPTLNNSGKIIFNYVGSYFEQDLISTISNLKQKYKDQAREIDFKTIDYDQLSILFHNTKVPKNTVELSFAPKEFFLKNDAIFHLETENVAVRSWVGSISAKSLYGALEKYGHSLFDLNVRYWKGFSSDVNNAIKKEYEKADKSNFWFLNNGINAVCRHFETKEDHLCIDSLQIVNGCQTSKALEHILNIHPSIHILFRLTEIKNNIAIAPISDQIAVASNKQNPISNRDLHSTDTIQKEIFKVLDDKSIFYDCKEGSWRGADKKKYKTAKYKWSKIKNTDIAISVMSLFLQTPVLSKGREKVAFSDEANYYEEIFDNSRGIESLVRRLMLAYRLRELVVDLKGKYEKTYPEFLNASNSTDITLALLSMALLKLDKSSFNSNRDDIRTKLREIDLAHFINENYELQQFEHLEKAFEIIAYHINTYLDVLKGLPNQEKLFNSTNWLKLEENYPRLVGTVFPKIANMDL